MPRSDTNSEGAKHALAAPAGQVSGKRGREKVKFGKSLTGGSKCERG